MPPLILASASPRRSQLLRDLGLSFQVVPSHAPEPPPTSADIQNPGAYVEKLAHLKSQSAENDAVVIAADTVVVLESGGQNRILGKPRDENEARAMLRQLRGQTHRVFTGVCVRRGAEIQVAHQITRVTFGDFSDEFIEAYVKTGEPMDKAGSYAAQGKGALLIERIEGDYFNVVGLPLEHLGRMLREFGVRVEAFWAA
jgi:septum formation protein